MRHAKKKWFQIDFLLMPPAYYKYGDDGAYSFYANVIQTKYLIVKLYFIILKNLAVINLVFKLLKN